jgi:hypothetical protein
MADEVLYERRARGMREDERILRFISRSGGVPVARVNAYGGSGRENTGTRS